MNLGIIEDLATRSGLDTSNDLRLLGDFAALIAEECAKLVDAQRFNVNQKLLYPPLSAAAVDAAAAIREKFGANPAPE